MFRNRCEAGNLLSEKLYPFINEESIIYAITRGGVVVGKSISKKFHIPLVPIVVKKLRAVTDSELAIGAITYEGVKYIDWNLALRSGVDQEYLDREISSRKQEVDDLKKRYQVKEIDTRRNISKVILIDDGIATGATVYAAIQFLRTKISDKIVLAIPVIAKDTYKKLQLKVDRIVALEIPDNFGSVGQFYKDFPQVTDEEVIKILAFRS